MFYHALASDYDGTLAHDGLVDEETLAAVERLKQTGRKFILVTGRELDDLKRVFHRLDICDAVVAENGALLYMPASQEEKPIASAPPAEFVSALEAKGVSPLSVGHTIVATWEPNESIVLETIRDMGLELEIIFNKGAVMVLPSGVNKATGLSVALQTLGLSPHNVIGIGDAENDHAFLRACGLSVAVDNALPAVKAASDLVTRGARGAGAGELIDQLIADEAQVGIPARHSVAVGRTRAGAEVTIAPGSMMMIAGTSGIGKSTLAIALTEILVEKGFQFLIFDPEGDYEGLENAVVLGSAHVPPQKDDVLELLADPRQNVVVNTLGLELAERPGFFSDLQAELGALRARTGRPHWLMVDEAHHLLPRARDAASLALGQDMPGMILITVHPDSVSADALWAVDMVVALGPQSDEVISRFCTAIDERAPEDLHPALGDDVLVWRRGDGGGVLLVSPNRPRQVHKRHTRKYAQGDLGPDKSFYFRGPKSALNLRAQNLMIFVQLAEGLDDATWEHHLRAGDYSRWLGSAVKDDDLAEEAAAIEADRSLSAAESRQLLAEAIRKRYTAPASVD